MPIFYSLHEKLFLALVFDQTKVCVLIKSYNLFTVLVIYWTQLTHWAFKRHLWKQFSLKILSKIGSVENEVNDEARKACKVGICPELNFVDHIRSIALSKHVRRNQRVRRYHCCSFLFLRSLKMSQKYLLRHSKTTFILAEQKIYVPKMIPFACVQSSMPLLSNFLLQKLQILFCLNIFLPSAMEQDFVQFLCIFAPNFGVWFHSFSQFIAASLFAVDLAILYNQNLSCYQYFTLVLLLKSNQSIKNSIFVC